MSVLRYRHLVICLILVTVLLCCTVTASAEFETSDSVNLANLYNRTSNIYNYLQTYLGGTNSIFTYVNKISTLLDGVYGVQSTYTLISQIEDFVSSISTSATSMTSYLNSIMGDTSYLTNLTDIESVLSGNLPDINSSTANIDVSTEGILTFLEDLNSMNWLMNASSEYSWFTMTGGSLYNLAQIYADPTDVYIDENVQGIKSDFASSYVSLDGVGSGIVDSFGLLGGLRDFFSLPDVDISSTFEQVESGYSSWFSAETAQALTVGAGAAAVAGIALMSEDEYVEPETPYLDAWNNEVQSILAGGDGEW